MHLMIMSYEHSSWRSRPSQAVGPADNRPKAPDAAPRIGTRLELDDLVHALGAVQQRVAVAGGDRVHQARRAQGRAGGFRFARRLDHRQTLR